MGLPRLVASSSRSRVFVAPSPWTPSSWLVASFATTSSRASPVAAVKALQFDRVATSGRHASTPPSPTQTARTSLPSVWTSWASQSRTATRRDPTEPSTQASPNSSPAIAPTSRPNSAIAQSSRPNSAPSPPGRSSPRPSRTFEPASARPPRHHPPSLILDTSGLPTYLPTTSYEFFSLLRYLGTTDSPHRTTHSRLALSALCAFHSTPQLAHLVTLRTYVFLLQRAYASSNYALASQLLSELTERGFSRDDEAVSRLVLRYALKRGDGQAVAEEAQRLRSQGLATLECLNWRRDLKEDGKGIGDGLPTWKGRERGRTPRKRKGYYEALFRGSASTSRTADGPVGTEDDHRIIDRLSTLLRRAPTTRSPSDLTRLVPTDIASLVDSFVLDRNAQRAFESAQIWLDKTRSKLTPASVGGWRARKEYEKTALVLLNILLKSLYASKVSTTSIRDFIEVFIQRHSISSEEEALQLRPGLSTLRTLVVGNTGYHGSWVRGVKVVEWFDREFGLPSAHETDKGSHRASAKVDDTVAFLLLGMAIKDQQRKRDKESRLNALVAEWWIEVEEVRKERGWGGLASAKSQERIKEARKLGLLGKERQR